MCHVHRHKRTHTHTLTHALALVLARMAQFRSRTLSFSINALSDWCVDHVRKICLIFVAVRGNNDHGGGNAQIK